MLLSLTVLWVDGAQMMGLGFFWWFLLGSLLWCSWMQLGMGSWGSTGMLRWLGCSPHVVSGPLQDRILTWLLRAPKTQKHNLPGCLMPGLWIPRTALLVSFCSFNQITGGQKLDVGGDYTGHEDQETRFIGGQLQRPCFHLLMRKLCLWELRNFLKVTERIRSIVEPGFKARHPEFQSLWILPPPLYWLLKVMKNS